MISILPAIHETLVIPISGVEAERRIQAAIDNERFNGICSQGKFRLFVRMLRPPQFQPFISGTIESTSRGCLVLLKHQLQPATRLLLVLVCIIILISGLVSVYAGSHWLYALAAMAGVVGVRGVALGNLHIHRNPLRQHLLDVLS